MKLSDLSKNQVKAFQVVIVVVMSMVTFYGVKAAMPLIIPNQPENITLKLIDPNGEDFIIVTGMQDPNDKDAAYITIRTGEKEVTYYLNQASLKDSAVIEDGGKTINVSITPQVDKPRG